MGYLLNKKRIVIIICTVLLVLLLYPITSYADKKVVKVGWYEAKGLQDGTSADDIDGYNYEYLAKIAQYTGWEYEFVFGDWKELEQELIDGNIDIIGDVAITEERLEKYNFCEFPNGYSRMLMVCRIDDYRFAFNDYDSFDGITVATIPSTFRKELLNREAEENDFNVTYREYPNNEEMFEALDQGEADVAILSNVTQFGAYKIVSEWEPNPYYFIINKDRIDLLDEIDEAMQRIQTNDLFMQERLFEKYFGENGIKAEIAFTREEKAYISEKEEINVLFDKSKYPLAYVEDNEPKGFYYDYLNKLSERTGLEFNYVICDGYSDMITKFNNGEGDISPYMPDDFKYALDNDASISQSYIDIRNGIITKRENSEIKSLAVLKDQSYFNTYADSIDAELVFYDNDEECIDAVESGAVDAAVMGDYCFKNIEYHSKYEGIIFEMDPNIITTNCIGINNANDERLYSVIEKAVNSISETEIIGMLTYINKIEPEYTKSDILNRNANAILIILAIIILALIIILNQKRRSLHEKRIKRMLEENNLQLIEANDKINNKTELLKKANDRLIISEEEAKSASCVKTDFLARMSHDMRTPLTALIGLSDFGIEEQRDDKDVEYFTKMRDSSEYLLSLVNDTLDLQKLESNKIELNYSIEKCCSAAKKVITIMSLEADRKGVELTSNTATTRFDEYIRTDEKRVEQILINILSNAIKYTPKGGNVTWDNTLIRIDEENMIIRNIITDSGVGMSKEFMVHMYEPFSKENNSLSNSESSTGLGLAICKNLIEIMGGSISCESELGKGTIFTIDIPHMFATKEEISKYLDEKMHEEHTAFAIGKIALICEDASVNAQILTKILKKIGMVSEYAENGLIGLNKARENKYDVIFMDIRMPIMDGLTAAAEIRKFDSNTPIIALSANAYDEDINKSIEAGMNAHLSKPFDKNDIFQELSKYL